MGKKRPVTRPRTLRSWFSFELAAGLLARGSSFGLAFPKACFQWRIQPNSPLTVAGAAPAFHRFPS